MVFVIFCILCINKKLTLNKQNSTLVGHTNLFSEAAVNPSINQKNFWDMQLQPTPKEKSGPPGGGVRGLPMGLPSYCPARITPFLEPLPSHRLAFAQEFRAPGLPFPLSLAKPSSFNSSSTPSSHCSLRKQHSPCLSLGLH